MTKNAVSPASIIDNLNTCFIGQKVFYYPTLPSTMDVARQAAREGAVEGAVVIADEQTAGRGRLGRAWLSPQGSIALSIILRPALVYLPFLIMIASLAVVYSIEIITGLKPVIKWPNDVLIQGKKVCGILTESDLRGDIVDFAIIGIGINVNLAPSAFPEISAIATSLSAELEGEVSRLDILKCLLVEVERLYLAVQAGEPVYEQWRDRLETIGKTVKVKQGETIEEGLAESVARDGSLLLRRPDGSLARILSGDVTLRSIP